MALLLITVAVVSSQRQQKLSTLDSTSFFKGIEVNALSDTIGATDPNSPIKIPVYSEGSVTPGFDPTISSQTCKPAPTQMKIFNGNNGNGGSNPEKSVYQDFTIVLPNSFTETLGGVFDLKLSVFGKKDPINPHVFPRTLKIVKDKEQRFSVQYKC